MPRPLRPLDRMFERIGERALRLEQAYVDDDAKALRALLLSGLTRLALCVALWVAWWFSEVPMWTTLLAPGAGAASAVFVMGMWTRALAYRRGWLEGRMRMVAALAEAQRRGLDLDDWLEGELDRNRRVRF